MEPDIGKEIGRRLRKLRERNGWSQQALGRKVGVSYQMIQKYERGRSLGAARLVMLADVLGVPPAEILPRRNS